MGRVDLHLHLLPGIDDGCKSLQETLELARALVSLGYTTVAPSPHNRSEYSSHSRELCLAKLAEVRDALAAASIPLVLEANAENFFLDERLFSSLGTPEARTVGDSRYLLIEAPYTSPLPMLRDFLFRMKLKGVTPLIAHPERCLEFDRPGRAAEVVQAGAALQLDLGALIGRYGKPAQKLARQWLDEGLYTVAATDCHSPVKAAEWLGASLRALEKAVGAGAAKLLLETNPAAILRGDTPA